MSVLALAAALAAATPAWAQSLALDDALRAARAQSPRLAAQGHAIAASAEQASRAGELPDPRLRFGIENLPVTGPDRYRYDRDFMTMRSVGWMQEFPNGAKREARSLRAGRQKDLEQAMLRAERVRLDRDTALAWFDVLFAERALDRLRDLVLQVEGQATAAQAGVAGGRRPASDVLAIRVAAERLRDRVLEQERAVARARAALGAYIGAAASQPLGAAPATGMDPAVLATLLSRLGELPELRAYDDREGVARAEVDLARAGARPDWSVEVGFAYREPGFGNMLSVMVAMDLPWQKERRQDRDIAARLAEVDQVRAMREQARRNAEAELRASLADHAAAGRRIERYRASLLPLAKERAAAARAAYQGGRGALAELLAANQAVLEFELELVALEADHARAWTRLKFLFDREDAA